MYALQPYTMAENTESHITHPLYAIAITLLLLYTLELYRKNITLQERLEKSVMPRLVALESVTKDLTATESARDKLLEEHGEDISLAAETAYYAVAAVAARDRCLALQPHPEYYPLDEPILKFLRKSPKKSAREILSHLSHDEAAQTEWKLKNFELEITHHDLNSRLYCLLTMRKLKNDNGARPLWSVTNLGKK